MEINGTEIMTHWDKDEINETLNLIFDLLKMRGIIDSNSFDWCDIENQIKEFKEFQQNNKK